MRNKPLDAYNKDVNSQIVCLNNILMSSKTLREVLMRAENLNIAEYYLGAGCVTQTVWNYLCGKPLEYGIKDIDLVYFDAEKLDFQSENEVILKAKELYSDLKLQVDVKNEARVHLWYKEHFGYDIKPYTSLEDAISTWPTTATAIGVRIDKDQALRVYAPFGLNDLFGKIVRANKAQITEEIYKKKVGSWTVKWPELKVIPWDK